MPTVDSAYYVGVAGRLASGQGLTADVLWTYASPPLTLPQPAFTLWMPLASLLAAIPMVLGGTTSLLAAQVAMIVVGAALAPLTWYVADQAAAANGLIGRRRATVALGSGLVAALFGPFLVAVTGPDSSVPFAVLAVAACCAMPRALDTASGRRWGVALGALLGLAYLARQEAIWLGLTYLLLLLPELRRRVPGERAAWLARSLGPVVVAGAIVVAPWLVRQALVFGSPFPGQAIQNLWFTRNQDVFAFAQPPTMAAFLAQGPAVIVEHIVAGLWHQLVDVLLLPTLPVGVFGLLGLGVGLAHPGPPRRDGVARPDPGRRPDVPGHGPPVPGRHAGRDLPARLGAGPRGPRGRRRAGDRPRRRGHRDVARLGQAERLAGAPRHARPGPARDGPRGLAHRLVRRQPGGAGERGGHGPREPGARPGTAGPRSSSATSRSASAWPPGDPP